MWVALLPNTYNVFDMFLCCGIFLA